MIAGHRASLVFLVHFEYTLARLPEVERINQLPCYYSTQLICTVKLITKRANDVTIINEISKGMMSSIVRQRLRFSNQSVEGIGAWVLLFITTLFAYIILESVNASRMPTGKNLIFI